MDEELLQPYRCKDPSLKAFGKHLGPFAAFKRDEARDGHSCGLF